jgi:7-cyano-7-deazaguanine synthase
MTPNLPAYPDLHDIVVLLSGGIDSVTALHYAVRQFKKVRAVSFDYGSRHNAQELAHAARQCRLLGIEHTIMPLTMIGEHFASHLLKSGGKIPDGHYQEESMKQTVVPFRNGIMLAVATGFAESKAAQAVLIAAHSGDHAIYPDCREAFMTAMSAAIATGTYAQIKLLRPFIGITKGDIVALGHDLSVDFTATWSCYKGEAVHCGVCGTCTERREAFQTAGLPDPTVYAQTPALPPAPGKRS